MRKIAYTLFIILYFVLIQNIHAQQKPTKVKIELIDGSEKFGFGKRFNKNIYLYKTRKKTKEKEIIPISNIKSIRFVFREGYREFNYLKDKYGKYRLLIPLIKGKVNLYKSFGRQNMGKINNDASVSYKVSKDGVNFITFRNFKKEALDFFGDCELITKKLKAHKFYRINLAEMVVIYNNDCSENQKSSIALKDLSDKKPVVFENPTAKLYKIVPAELIDEKKVTIKKEKVLINLNPIYFNLDKYEIVEQSQLELDKVIKLMKEYPKINIVINSHTDSRGSEEYNLDLSAKRANEVAKYIIKHNINSTRISAFGYGEKELLNNCTDTVKCTELEHAKNRRTEFIIINPKELKK